MRSIFFLLLTVIACNCQGQITVDTTKEMVVVKEKMAGNVKTMTIYKSFVPGRGMCNQVIYQADAAEFGEEPPTLVSDFVKEEIHLKSMLDAALKKKQFNFSRISINIQLYNDMIEKLVELYVNSKEWNDYLKKAGNLVRTAKLYDGSEVTEVVYDAKLAGSILDKSDFLKEPNNFFGQYGYKAGSGGFADEHQQTVAPEKLVAMGKNSNMVVPVPNNFFTLTKIK